MTEEMEGQMSIFDLDGWFGKTYPEHSVQTKEKTSKPSSRKSSGLQNQTHLMCLCLKKESGPTQESYTMRWGNGVLPTKLLMPNTGERRSEEDAFLWSLTEGGYKHRKSCLSNILEQCPNPKYNLSPRACQGILNRATKRGKKLPEQLDMALRAQSVSKNEQENLGGGKGILIQDERTGALSTLNNQSVFGICSYDSNSMKSPNPNSGIYEAETSRTLDLNGGSPDCNQGGMVVLEGNGSRESHKGDGYAESETMYTLNTVEQHAVAYRKQGHPMNAEQGQGWEEAVVNDTLNIFDNSEARTPTVVIENHPNDSRVKIREDGMVQTLSGRMGTGGGNVPLVMEQSSWDGSQISPTLTANNAGGSQRMPDKDNFNAVIAFTPDSSMKNTKDGIAYSMLSRDYKDPQCVAYGLDRAAYNQGQNALFNFSIEEEKIGAQVAKGPGAVCAVDCRNGKESEINATLQADAYHNINSNNVCRIEASVRRLTPLECERLQGYPDGWTDIGDWVDSKGKKHKGDSDSPRYKALGNSIALPSWYHLLKEISNTYEDGYTPTLGSLFDGIGGFPLCWELINGKGSARWASEIEEFPIAVTKKRFPEGEET